MSISIFYNGDFSFREHLGGSIAWFLRMQKIDPRARQKFPLEKFYAVSRKEKIGVLDIVRGGYIVVV